MTNSKMFKSIFFVIKLSIIFFVFLLSDFCKIRFSFILIFFIIILGNVRRFRGIVFICIVLNFIFIVWYWDFYISFWFVDFYCMNIRYVVFNGFLIFKWNLIYFIFLSFFCRFFFDYGFFVKSGCFII